jgi:hypothetical protein
VIAAIIAYLLLGVVRPLVKTMLPSPPESEASVGGNIDLVAGEEGDEAKEHVPTAAELFEETRGRHAPWHNRTRIW